MSKFNLKTTKLPKSEVEVEAEISADTLTQARVAALKKWSETLEIPGFRKGKVPENVLLSTMGESKLLEEAADIALQESYSDILKELNLETIGRPTVSIVKLAFGNPLSVKIKTAVLPEFKLPDYKKISREVRSMNHEGGEENSEPTEKEIQDVILQIRKNKAHADWHTKNPEEKDHSKHPNFDTEENLPELNDEFAKLIGGFESVEKLKEKIKENLIQEKKTKHIEKIRAAIMDAMIEKTEIEMPEILIETEVNKSLAQVKDDITRIGGKFDDYLKHIKKTEDDLKQELRGEAEKRAKLQLVFNKIADAEKIVPDKDILEHETKKILEYYPEAHELNARIYVATQLTNSEVLKVLENQ